MADRHAIIKNGAKEIAYNIGKSVCFMAKWDYGMAGNSSHIHQSLWSLDGKPLFFEPSGNHGMSDLMKAISPDDIDAISHYAAALQIQGGSNGR